LKKKKPKDMKGKIRTKRKTSWALYKYLKPKQNKESKSLNTTSKKKIQFKWGKTKTQENSPLNSILYNLKPVRRERRISRSKKTSKHKKSLLRTPFVT